MNSYNSFQKSLEYEQTMIPRADEAYKNLFSRHDHELVITRYDYNDPMGRKMQKNGADLKLTLKDKYGNSGSLTISEKFRSADWGDMFVELYSQYPRVQGWGVTSQGVDFIAYFTPKKLYFVNYGDLLNVASDIIFTHSIGMHQEISDSVLEHNRNDYRSNIDLKVIPTYTTYDKPAWKGVGVGITWEALKAWGVKYLEFDLE